MLSFSGNMVINETEKTLIQVMTDAKKITIPAQVKWIEPTAITKYKIKKLVIPKKTKRVDKWKKPYITNNKKIKIYYCGKRIR